MLAVFGVQSAGECQEQGKGGQTHKVAPEFGKLQGVFHVNGYPVGHGVFRGASQKNAYHAKSKTNVLAPCGAFRGDLRGDDPGQRRYGKQNECHQGQSRPKQRQIHPVFRAEYLQKYRADDSNTGAAVAVQRVQDTHIPLRVIRGQGSQRGTQQNLVQTCGKGKDHCTQK